MAARRTTRSASKPHAARKPRRRETQLAFEALAIEGGLLSPDWLARVAALDAGGQSEADYRVPKGLQLRDEIGRYWRIAQAYWSDFASGRDSAKGSDAARALSERFVLALLRESFGFASLVRRDPQVITERSYPVGFAALGGRVPLVIAPADSGLDNLAPALGDGLRRRSAFGLAQEYLNASEGATWGIASDGLVLRILRDNASLTRPAWIEADLYRIFTEERYSDFTALWLLAHETRFGRADQPPTECALETWRDAGREEGTRAREHLRRGVEEAIEALGQGFLAHPENAALRATLQDGSLSTTAYFQELLRLVYRVIFLLTVEERGLLHTEAASEAARRLYAEGYSLRRLRERSVRRSAHDRFSDLWEATKIVFRGVGIGEPRLALPALAGIFALPQCPTLDAAKLENRALLLAMFRLSWLREASGLVRVNWRDMDSEELGSVYESLLQLVPQVTQGGRVFAFATGGETKGNARKTSGSYYTPDSLVQVLLESALEPVVADTLAASPERPVEALLDLSIVDPACGSGHFLLAAARRLAGHVARFQANGTPSAAEYRHALRQVVGRCLYGVDLNPMAVELCKVSLWMEAVEPGLPLTFLDAHIRHGNALLGTTPELMAEGIPDAAWSPIEGDDRKVASGLKKRNKRSEGGQRALDTLWTEPRESETEVVARAVAELEAAPDTDAESLARKEERWDDLLDSEAYRHQKLVADAWCAAFVWPKQPGPLQDAAPTNDVWIQIRDHQGLPNPLTVTKTRELAEQYRFFHWDLAFPQVFKRGGFDVVLGNPPWDSVRFNEEEFFAGPRPSITLASTAAVRKHLVAKLEAEDPSLFRAYQKGLREVNGINAFVRSGVRYPLCGVGRVNLFALFAEAARSIVNERGRVGQILPSGIVSDDSTKLFFQSVIEKRQLVSFFDFENRDGIFGAVHRSFKFGIFTLAGAREAGTEAEFVFFATHVDHLKDPERRITLSTEDIVLLNPATKTCPIFRSRRDAEITKAIYRRLPVLTASGWKLELTRLINQSDDSGSFRKYPADGLLPLYEGKYFHHYDHRWATNADHGDRELTDLERADPECFVRPRFWYPASDARQRFSSSWKHPWVLAWRDIARSTDERTFIASVLPSLAVPNTAKVIFAAESELTALPTLIANIGTFAFDFVSRQKIGGTHMSTFVAEQLPVLPADASMTQPQWARGSALRKWLLPRVLELTYTAWDLEPFAHDVGYDGPPFRWASERRFLLRAELDAAFFHLYGLSHDDAGYILDTFPIVRKNDERAYSGVYRTRTVILEIYNAMAEAVRTGQPYATRLDPPPADPRVAHRPRTASVLPFPSRPFVLPAWGNELFVDVAARAQVRLEAGAWGTSLSGENLGISALAAVLRSLPGPVARGDVERAVVLALIPRLMQPHFDSTSEKTWRSVIGRENLGVTSVSTFGIPWTAVIRSAIHQKVLAEAPDGRWSAGSEVANAPSPALDARALVVLAWLATAPVEDAELTTQMEDLFHVA